MPDDQSKPYVVKPQDAGSTAQTPGMLRIPGVTAASTGASRIWLGTVTAAPHMRSLPHHHGEAETAVYILRGHLCVYFGEGFTETVEAGPGEFLYVPPLIPHIEENPYDEEYEAVLARSPDNIVVNLE